MNDTSTALLLVRVGLSLGIVVGLILVASRVLRRRGGGSPTRRLGPSIELLERRNMGKRSSVALIRVDDRRVLVGVTEHQIGLSPTSAPRCQRSRRASRSRASPMRRHLDATASTTGHLDTLRSAPADDRTARRQPRPTRHRSSPGRNRDARGRPDRLAVPARHDADAAPEALAGASRARAHRSPALTSVRPRALLSALAGIALLCGLWLAFGSAGSAGAQSPRRPRRRRPTQPTDSSPTDSTATRRHRRQGPARPRPGQHRSATPRPATSRAAASSCCSGLTVLAIAPSLVMMVTSFTRMIVTLSIARNAVGMQTMPPNQVITGLALFLTLFVMAPVITDDQRHRVAALPRRASSRRARPCKRPRSR